MTTSQLARNIAPKAAAPAIGFFERYLTIWVALCIVAGPRGMTPGVMAEGSGIPAATLSFHLKELMNAGLVTQERLGRNLVYRAAFDHMTKLLGYLTENCCQGEQCIASEATTIACKC